MIVFIEGFYGFNYMLFRSLTVTALTVWPIYQLIVWSKLKSTLFKKKFTSTLNEKVKSNELKTCFHAKISLCRLPPVSYQNYILHKHTFFDRHEFSSAYDLFFLPPIRLPFEDNKKKKFEIRFIPL